MSDEHLKDSNVKPKVITNFIVKGGVGKTTTIGNTLHHLSKYHLTLGIDADNQGNLTELFNSKVEFLERSNGNTLADFFLKEKKFSDCLYQPRLDNKNLYLIGTSTDNKLMKYINESIHSNSNMIEQLINQAKLHGFKFIVIDMPCDYGLYSKFLLSMADINCAIIEPEAFGYESLPVLMSCIKEVEEDNFKKIYKKGLIINKYNKNNASHKFYKNVFDPNCPFDVFIIPESHALISSCSYNKLLHEYKNSHQINQIFRNIADYLMNIKI